jgi:hypothetical protein
MANAFLVATSRIRTRNPIAQQFPELLCDDNEDMLFIDCIDQLETYDMYSDGRTAAHLQQH